MKLVSMAQKPSEAKEERAELAAEAKAPRFPYGLELTLNEEVLEKLGWKDLPKVGAKCTIEAKGVVTLVRNVEGKNHSSMGVNIQITELGITNASTSKSAADTLYPSGTEKTQNGRPSVSSATYPAKGDA